MPVRLSRFALCAACAVLLALLASGCSSPAGKSTAATPAEKPATAPATQEPTAEAIQAMSVENKRSVMAEGFPIELPVPQGTITRAQAQGTEVWDYEISVAASPDALAQWFVSAYTGRNWQVVGQGPLTEGSGGSYLELRKGSAESRVDIVGGADGGHTTARVVVGIGTPVLGTY